MTSTVDDLLDEYGGADLSLAHVLCDRHSSRSSSAAFTIIDADLDDIDAHVRTAPRHGPSVSRPRSPSWASARATALRR